MRGTLARQRRRDTAAAVDDRSWLPSAAEVAEALHMVEARDGVEPPSQRPTPSPRSWAIHVPAEEWAKIPAWWSGGHWFDTLLDWMPSLERDKARKRWHVADATLLAIAHVLRYAAEPSTGRHVTLSYATIRARVQANTEAGEGRTIRLKADESVRLAIRTLEAGGFLHVHATGRNLLSREEKAEAFETHGGRQEQAANVLALTLPALQAVENSGPTDIVLGLTAPVLAKPSSSVDLEQQSPREMERATRARPNGKRVDSDDHSTYVPERGRSLDRQRLLAHLDRHYGGVLAGPRLGKSGKLLKRHIGQVEHALISAGVDLNAWAWWQIAELVDARHSGEKTTSHQRIAAADDPLSYFIWMVKQVIRPGDAPRTIVPSIPIDFTPPQPPAAATGSGQPPAPTAAVDDAAADAIERIRCDTATELQQRRARLAEERRMITDNLLGAGMQPADFPEIVRTLHAEIQRMHEILTRRGWMLDHDELHHDVILWTHPASYVNVDDQDDRNTTTSIRFAPPATAADRDMYVLNTAGRPHTDQSHSLGGILRALETA
jgi:hypothetical protein